MLPNRSLVRAEMQQNWRRVPCTLLVFLICVVDKVYFFPDSNRSVRLKTRCETYRSINSYKKDAIAALGSHGGTAAYIVSPLVEIRVARGAFQRERFDVANRFHDIFQANDVPLVP